MRGGRGGGSTALERANWGAEREGRDDLSGQPVRGEGRSGYDGTQSCKVEESTGGGWSVHALACCALRAKDSSWLDLSAPATGVCAQAATPAALRAFRCIFIQCNARHLQFLRFIFRLKHGTN
jgi:hypothetical protein